MTQISATSDSFTKLFFPFPETSGWLVGLIVGLLMFGGCFPMSSQAQWQSAELEPLSPAAQAKGGIQLVRRGNPQKALPYLQNVFAAHPDLVLPNHGAVAFWLGEAYARTGDSTMARSTWRTGIQVLRETDQFDVRLADAYLSSLTRTQLRGERLQAVDVYMELLGRIGPDTTSDVQNVYRRRMAQIVPLMTDDVFAQSIEGKRSEDPSTWSFRPGAGDSLQAWWRGLDPYPDTRANERLEEHLARLIHARRTFGCAERASGFDARGTTYLRFGAPYKRRDLKYKDGEFFDEVLRFGVPIPPNAFPESEIWLYPQISESGYFLFAEEEGSPCYGIARANDLLPKTLQMPRGSSERSLNIAYSSLMAMRAIYRQLALYHIDFSGRYSEIADYATYQEMRAAEAKIRQMSDSNIGGGAGQNQVTVGSGVGMTRTVTSNPALGIDPLNHFISRMVNRASREDAAAADRRKEEMPRQYTALYDNVPELPVSMRIARFLNDDGTTRTLIYWGVDASALRLQPDEEDEDPAPSMIRFNATHHNEDRTKTQRKTQHHRLAAKPEQTQDVLVPSPMTFDGTSSQQHLSLQWTQHRMWQDENGAVSGIGPKRRYTVTRADSLPPLRASGPQPEMSDLLVLSLPDMTAETLTNPAAAAYPYPFESITAGTPLLLSFEVYHLAYGKDDRTRYTISYEVEGQTKRGWSRLYQGQDTQRTTTETTMGGTERDTEERILLDLSRISRDEPQDVRVTVEVTDEVTNASVTRSVNFVLQPKGDS